MEMKAGTRLGQYEVVGLVGAGGMGEVYRARDSRLQRDVAVKVLPASFASDTQRLRRFEQEALATAALNHPNILAVFDIGTHQPVTSGGDSAAAAAQECPYIVTELLDGESLRERVRGGSLPLRKAIDYASQIARGLAAAHDKGIIHRDLKPENIFITSEGQAKILDFGLAKLVRPDASADGQSLTRTIHSEVGSVLGTIGYMSPEQVRGKPIDARSDLFSFGTIFFEMLSGKRLFHGESSADVMSAILHQEPPELTTTNRAVSPALERIVRHCLEKNPAERFQSARDIAFDLEMLSGTSQSSALVQPVSSDRAVRRLFPLIWIAALVVVAIFAYSRGKRGGSSFPDFRELSFERGAVANARFTQDGRSVLYDASWDGKPVRVFATPVDSAQPRALGLDQGHLYSVSRTGELAIGMGGVLGNHLDYRGATLGRAPAEGGAARAVLDNVADADWAPDGTLAVVHTVNGHDRIEFPVGKVLFETSGWIAGLRFCLKGDQLAFIEHPRWPDDRGIVSVVDLKGNKRTLSEEYESLDGLAWASDTEIWFTGTAGNSYRSVQAVTTSGQKRVVLRVPGMLTLFDVSPEGRALIGVNSEKVGVKGRRPSQTTEQDLSWSGWTIASDISPDYRLMLNEQSVIAGPDYIVGMRTFDGSAPVRLGVGNAGNLSPDTKWVSSVPLTGAARTVLYPIGVGAAREIPANLQKLHFSTFIDNQHLLLEGYEAGHAARCYVQEIESGKTTHVTSEGSTSCVGSSDGRMVAAPDASGKLTLYPADGSAPRAIPGDTLGMVPIRFGVDGKLYASRNEVPARITQINTATGEQKVIYSLEPGDAAGLIGISPVALSPDAKAYAYSYRRTLTELYLVEGLK